MDKKTLLKLYKGKRVLIAGGAGFIGSRLAKELVKYGSICTVVDAFLELGGANDFNLKEITGKIRLYKSAIEDFVRGKDLRTYEVIFNCCGLTDHFLGLADPLLDYRINCLGAIALLLAMKGSKTKPKLISIGSRTQYGRARLSHLKESSSMQPLDIQSTHKITLEHYHRIFAKMFGLDTVFLRLTNVYGPGQRLKGHNIGFMGEVIKNTVEGKIIPVYGSPSRIKDILFINDAVAALLLSGLQKSGCGFKVYNVGGKPYKVSDLIKGIKKIIPGSVIEWGQFPQRIRDIDTGDVVLSSDKIKKELKWAPKTALMDGLKETLDYYKRQGKHYL